MKFISNVLRILSGRIFFACISIVTSAIIARTLMPEVYGVYKILFVIPALVLNFGSFWQGPAYVYYLNQEKGRLSSITSNAVVQAVFLGSIYFVICFLCVDLMQEYFFKHKIGTTAIILAFLSVPLSLFQKYTGKIVLGLQEIRIYNYIIFILGSLVKFVLCVLFLIVLKMGIVGAVFALLLTTLSIDLVLFCYLWGRTRIVLQIDREMLRKTMSYGLKGYLGGVIKKVDDQIVLILLMFFLGFKEVGIFAIGMAVAQKVTYIPISINTTLFPSLSAADRVGAGSLFRIVMRNSIWLMIGVCIICGLFSRIAVGLIYGKEYLDAIGIIYLLLPGMVFVSVIRIGNTYLAGSGRPLWITYFRICGLFITVLSLPFLLKVYGLIGAGIAVSVSYIILGVIMIGCIAKFDGISVGSMLIPTVDDLSYYKDYYRNVILRYKVA